ncbi:MAG: hypothetical protein CMN77_13025 [Spirochaetaceae bacterium]|nr:hypothetical protein [Spirochaetaceae bacterium]|tara:strand:+ start:11942 stop:13426 length:1485 start_codon:yes stop_codon:yes gene_type:complete
MKLLSNDYNRTTGLYLIISTLWLILGVAIRVVNEIQMITFMPGPDSYFSYGYLRPVGSNLLIFGGLLGYFFALGYQIINERASSKVDLAGLAALGAHQTALLFGVLTIFAGYNTGREYGELNWIADNLMMLVFTVFLVLLLIALWGKEDLKSYEKMAAATIGGMLLFYFLGNFGMPNGLLVTTAPTSGAQDALVAEMYRNAVLTFFILFPLFTMGYYWLEKHYELPVFSEATVHFQIVAGAALVPLAAGGALLGTADAKVLQYIGTGAALALTMSLLGGVANIHYSLSRSGKIVSSDQDGKALRWGLILVGIYLSVRFILQIPLIGSNFRYMAWNNQDLYSLASTAVLPLALASAYLLLGYWKKASTPSALKSFGNFFLYTGIITFLAAALIQGWIQAFAASSLTGEGAEKALENPAWAQVLFAGSLETEVGKDALFSYLYSVYGFVLLGLVMTLIGSVAGIIAVFAGLSGKSAAYSRPSVVTEAPVTRSAESH